MYEQRGQMGYIDTIRTLFLFIKSFMLTYPLCGYIFCANLLPDPQSIRKHQQFSKYLEGISVETGEGDKALSLSPSLSPWNILSSKAFFLFNSFLYLAIIMFNLISLGFWIPIPILVLGANSFVSFRQRIHSLKGMTMDWVYSLRIFLRLERCSSRP
jgi:hypothetical protein